MYKTDGLNNIRKAENFKGELFVIKSERDDFMGFQPVEKTEAKVKTTTTTPSKTGEEVKTTIKNVQSNKYGRNLADDLLQAKYKDSEEKDSKQVTFKGGHCSWEPEKLQGLESSLEQAFPSIAAA